MVLKLSLFVLNFETMILENIVDMLSQKEKIKASLDKSSLDIVACFTILWNIYERGFYSRKYLESVMIDRVEQNHFNGTDFNVYYTLFSNRYFLDKLGVVKFDSLKFSGNVFNTDIARHDFTWDILSNELSLYNDKVKAVLLIIYRLRNNLFHGEKDILTLSIEAEPVSIANECLFDIIKYNDFIYS